MLMSECATLMGPLAWVIPASFLLLAGLGVAAMLKYLISPTPRTG